MRAPIEIEVLHQHDVLGLDVAVRDPVLVQEGQRTAAPMQHGCRELFRQTAVGRLDNPCEGRCARTILSCGVAVAVRRIRGGSSGDTSLDVEGPAARERRRQVEGGPTVEEVAAVDELHHHCNGVRGVVDFEQTADIGVEAVLEQDHTLCCQEPAANARAESTKGCRPPNRKRKPGHAWGRARSRTHKWAGAGVRAAVRVHQPTTSRSNSERTLFQRLRVLVGLQLVFRNYLDGTHLLAHLVLPELHIAEGSLAELQSAWTARARV